MPTRPTTPAPPALVDAAELRRALPHYLPAGEVREVRILEAVRRGARGRPLTLAGYFTDPARAAEAIVREAGTLTAWLGCYVTINPLMEALHARSPDRFTVAGRGDLAKDHEVLRRTRLLLDFDPRRPSGISATDAEHEAALDRARTAYRDLRAHGWPDPLVVDSGNGAHLVYAVDQPADDGGLIERVLRALAARHDDAAVELDQTVHTAARITKLPGTLACKGAHYTEEAAP